MINRPEADDQRQPAASGSTSGLPTPAVPATWRQPLQPRGPECAVTTLRVRKPRGPRVFFLLRRGRGGRVTG